MLLFTFLGTKKSVTVRKKNCKSVSKKALIEFFLKLTLKSGEIQNPLYGIVTLKLGISFGTEFLYTTISPKNAITGCCKKNEEFFDFDFLGD